MKPKCRGRDIPSAEGRLGVLSVGLGSVSTTMMAGVFAARKGIAEPIGSITQTGKIRLGKRTENRTAAVKDFAPLAGIADLVFGGWDIFSQDAYWAASQAGVLEAPHLEAVREDLSNVRPMPAVFDPVFNKRLQGAHRKRGKSKMDLADQLRRDMEAFAARHGLKRLVVCWTASTEAYKPFSDVHSGLAAFEDGLRNDHPNISPSQIYAYAALSMGFPFINGAPQFTAECPALLELAELQAAPVCGKDFKTGQSLMKTIVAPGLRARLLGVAGWFSTNILGNKDGEVLDDPETFKSKEVSKLGVLDTILKPDEYPELYGRVYHKIRIDYYPPRGDNKESWDSIDIFGWMGYPMQIKINFLCRDSILAAPVMLDLILFSDLAKRAGMRGVQEWLSFYFKSPMTGPGRPPENDLFIQREKMENMLRFLMEEEPVHRAESDFVDDVPA